LRRHVSEPGRERVGEAGPSAMVKGGEEVNDR